MALVYAGFVEAPNWGISLRKGHHEPLICFETFQKIQERLKGHTKAPARKNLNLDFPLRGFVTCADCGNPRRPAGRQGAVGIILIISASRRTDARAIASQSGADVLEGEFETLLKQLRPSENLFRAARAMFEDLWNHRLETGAEQARSMKAELLRIGREVDQFLDRIADANIPSIIKAYESRIQKA